MATYRAFPEECRRLGQVHCPSAQSQLVLACNVAASRGKGREKLVRDLVRQDPSRRSSCELLHS
jgi:hypothetical protein